MFVTRKTEQQDHGAHRAQWVVPVGRCTHSAQIPKYFLLWSSLDFSGSPWLGYGLRVERFERFWFSVLVVPLERGGGILRFSAV